jgi:hypothetical protein
MQTMDLALVRQFPDHRAAGLSDSRRVLQPPEPHQPRYAEQFCEHAAVGNHHRRGDTGSRSAVGREGCRFEQVAEGQGTQLLPDPN